MIGETVGSYKITDRLGQGGMGVVWIAEHPLIGRKAAVKTLLPELSSNHELVSRFFNEARSSAMIKHPGIVDIFDFGYHASGCAFLVMEFLEGEPLGSRVRRMGALPEPYAIGYLRQAAAALAAAHAKGIVHRDLKPDNMFLVPDAEVAGGERLKILDFGIAKLSTEMAGTSKTRTGSVMGSPSYMSPEQCKGAGLVDERSDVYSLGCVFFELLTGRPPFLAEGVGEVLAMHIYENAVSVRSLVPTISPAVDAIVTRCLAKRPEDRIPSMAELMRALDATGSTGQWARAQTPVAGVPIVSRPMTGQPTPAPGQMMAPAVAAPTVAPVTNPRPGGTTLSSSAGQASSSTSYDDELPARKSRAPLYALAATVVVGGVALAVVLGGGGGKKPVTAAAPAKPDMVETAPTPAPPMPEPAPAPTVAPEPAPPVAPVTQVVLKITSDPPGADVYRMPAGVRVGVTPYDLKTNAADGEIIFLLKKSGYTEQQIALRADKDDTKSVKLDKAHRSSSKTPPATTTPPVVTTEPAKEPPPKKEEKKRKKGEALDPFGD